MNASVTPRELMEAWVLAAHQRLERLLVPAFAAGPKAFARQPGVIEGATLRLLPTLALPRELGDLDGWLGGEGGTARLDGAVALSLFFRYLAAPLRYEPASESAIHKAVPSSRGRYPLCFFLLQTHAGSTRAYAYVPEFHGLRALDGMAPAGLENDATALVCVGRAWRYAEEYGEFAHVPCVLEAGHALAQAQLLASLLGMAAPVDPPRELGGTLCELPLELPLFCLGLRVDADVEFLAARTVKLATPRPCQDIKGRFPRLSLFQRCFDGGAGNGDSGAATRRVSTLPDAALPGVGTRAILELLRRRTAANDRGLVSSVLRKVPAGTFDSLVASWRAIGRRRGARGDLLGYSLVWLGLEQGQIAAIHHVGREGLTAAAWRGELHEALARMLPYPNTRYNLAALTAILIIHADLLAAIEQRGAAALREIYLAAGAAAQDFSLAATAHDMFSRPMKMMREARLESELALPGQAVYLVLCGFARSANPTMELA